MLVLVMICRFYSGLIVIHNNGIDNDNDDNDNNNNDDNGFNMNLNDSFK